MVNYKQILTVAFFGMVNLCILGTVVNGEKIAVNGGVETDGLNPDEETFQRAGVTPTDNQPGSEINELDEMVDTLEALKREKAELDILKSKFHGAEKLAEVKRENDKERKKKNENDEKNESEMLLTNNEKAENNEKSVDVQDIPVSAEEEKEIEEIITLENEDEKMQEIENVVKNEEETGHHFEIAESLYKLGEYKTALDIYKLIDNDKIENERKIWVLYQIANCYRKQELYNDAVKVYKELRDEYDGTYWSKQAQWYIQDIEWRTRVEEKMVKVIER